MARRTADDFVAEIRSYAGGETTEDLTDARILRMVNSAYLTDVAAVYPFTELEASYTITTSANTAEYEMYTNSDTPYVLKILTVTDTTNGLRLKPMARWQYDEWLQGSTTGTTGPPVWFFESGVGSNNRKQLTFYPTPAGAYSVPVIFNREPAEMVQSPSATSPITPPQWDDVILHWGVSRAWRSLGDQDQAYKWQQTAQQMSGRLSSGFYGSMVPERPVSMVARAVNRG